MRFPSELAIKLATATTANLTADALPDRWVAVLEAAAFSPVRTHVLPTAKPTHVSDELLATVKRVGPLLPQIAALFEIEVSRARQRTQAPSPDPPGRRQEAGTPPRSAQARRRQACAAAARLRPGCRGSRCGRRRKPCS